MKSFLFIIFIVTLTLSLNALGTLRVESIKELPATHTNLKVYDADGKYAPVLLVKTNLKGIGIQNIGRPTKHAPQYSYGDHQYKFYMNDSQRVVRFTHADYEPLEVRLLVDFGINVKAQRVYEMELAFDKEVVQIPVMISCNQSGAKVYIDGDSVGKTKNKILTANIGSGSRVIKIEKDGFGSQEITENVSMRNNSFDFKLVPAMPAAVTITTNPTDAEVYINNIKFGTTPKSSFFDAGTYPIRIEKDNYETINSQITIVEPETNKSYNLTDIRATLTIKTHPNATVCFNGQSYKGGVSNKKISPQVLEISVTMPKTDTIERIITLKPKAIETLEIFPEVQTGTIQVMTIPTNAEIELNGDGGEHYTAIGRKTFVDVPIGKYDLTVKAEGYKTHKEDFHLTTDETIPKQIPLEEGSDVPDNMVFVQGGTFQMGSNEQNGAKPIHSVTVSDFFIGKTEVTQKEWRDIMGSNPSGFKGDNLPVEKVSWYDAVEFCNKKSRAEGLTLCYTGSGKNTKCDFSANGYRLPTEAEWEYAARGGYKYSGWVFVSRGRNSSRGHKYSGSNSIEDVAWYISNSNNRTHFVGTKQANELGLYDMSGNVREWCNDWYEAYSSSSQTNPNGASSGSFRVYRGGSWDYGAEDCRIAIRYGRNPAISYGYLGFRIVMTQND
jgi:formylglycine-generating enzyme